MYGLNLRRRISVGKKDGRFLVQVRVNGSKTPNYTIECDHVKVAHVDHYHVMCVSCYRGGQLIANELSDCFHLIGTAEMNGVPYNEGSLGVGWAEIV